MDVTRTMMSYLLIVSLAQTPQGGQRSIPAAALRACRSLVSCSRFSLVTFCLHKRLNAGPPEGFVSLYATSLSQFWLSLSHRANAVFTGYALPASRNLTLFIRALLHALGRHTSLANR